ncbi:MAG TPA: hypothetical protein VGB77_20380, partial [Abditibacteriaceae bacterium]
HLLQRMEEFDGIVILTTNLRQNIDDAFMRRIQTIVDFPFPSADARLGILRGLLPQNINLPTTEDLRILAEQFELAGGNLKNIVVDATFRALSQSATNYGAVPTMTLRHLVVSIAREYQKLGKPITTGEFGETFYAWVSQDILRPNPTAYNRIGVEIAIGLPPVVSQTLPVIIES